MRLIPFILLTLSFNILAAEWVVEFEKAPTKNILNRISKKFEIERFDDFNSDYFKRAYLVKTTLPADKLKFELTRIAKVVGVEGIGKVEAFSIQASPEQTRLQLNDQLFSYQWGLVSQGQKVRRDKDDINYVLIEDPATKQQLPDWLAASASSLPPEVFANLLQQYGFGAVTKAADVNYVGFLEAIKNREAGRTVKVAVIDSGIDLGHPEFKNVIEKNIVECKEDGSTDYETREDRDDNGVPGDCLGWNFTVHKNDPRAKLPMDDSGHGTHVAGIIAAEGSNNTGVSGLGKNIKIVPIKVLNSDESSAESRQIALTDRIARGILYAIKRNVDVINLSLGWLRQLDSKYLREAVNSALARGIPVIAAAGNNGSNARLYPCAYPGVICVGATRIDGGKADFSNHGGNVDVYAPGDSIVSSWPISLVPMDFSVHGYEIQSGTSQATPFVSGAVAQLISHIPNLSIPEIQARITLGANSDMLKDQMDLGLSGRLDMAASLMLSEQSAVAPVFKSLDEISYTLNNRAFRVPLPIVNYWKDSDELTIKVEVDNKAIELKRNEFKVPQIKQAKSITLPIEGEIVDLKADRSAKIIVTISEGEKTRRYAHSVNFVRLLIDDPEVEEVTVKFNDKIKPLAVVQEDKLVPLVSTAESFYGTSVPEWFLRRNTESGIDMTFFALEDQGILEKETITLTGAKRILGLVNADFNRDGIDDRLMRTTSADEEGNENTIVYSFRSKDGKGLYGEALSDWNFAPEVAVANETLAFASAKLNEQVVVAPVFVAEGTLPEHQQPTGFFDQRDEALRKRIYLLEPQISEGKVVLKTIAIDTRENVEKWKAQLGLGWSDPLRISTVLAPTLAEHEQGIVRILISAGFAAKRIDAVLTIKDKSTYELTKINIGKIRPEGQDAVRVAKIDGNRFARYEQTGFIGFYDGKRARTSVIGQSLVTQPYVLKDEFDNYSGHVASFSSSDKLTSVYTTQNKLVLVQDNGLEKKVLERPLERFDFLPGQVFNELFWPIARENEFGKLMPSLYVDASGIHSNSVHVIEAQKGGFVAPIAQSVLLPPNCKALNPVVLPGEHAHRTSMICLEKERGFVFKFVK